MREKHAQKQHRSIHYSYTKKMRVYATIKEKTIKKQTIMDHHMIEVDSKILISRLYNIGCQVTEPEPC